MNRSIREALGLLDGRYVGWTIGMKDEGRDVVSTFETDVSTIAADTILRDVVAVERSMRRVRRYIASLTNKTITIAAPVKHIPRIDDVTRARARRALKRSSYVEIKK
jgi:hypothetical protein